MKPSTPYIAIVGLGLLLAGCPTDESTENLPPTIQLDVSSSLEYVVGEGIVNITVTAEDPEGGGVTIGVVDPPARATFQLFDGWGAFQWDPLASDVTPQGEPRQLVFYAEDDFGGRSERTVTISIVPGNGLPRFTNSPSVLHNIDSGKPVTFNVTVRDDDSQRVAIVMPNDKAPDGAMFTVTSDFAGQFRWEPTPEQLEYRAHSVTFVANDGQNDPVEQKVSILLKKGTGDETTRPPPDDPADPTSCHYEDRVKHEPLGPQRGAEDYRIEARLAGDAIDRHDRLVLNWSTEDVYNNQEIQMEGAEMTLEEGVYVGTIPNPLLPAGETTTYYYEVCAIDDDSSDDDSVLCGPSSIYHSFNAYSPDTASCIDDAFVNQTFESAWSLNGVLGWEHHRGCGDDAPDYYRMDLEPQQDGDIYFTYPFDKGVDIEMYDEEKNLLPLEPSACTGYAYTYIENATDEPLTRYFRVIADDLPYQISPWLFEPDTTCVETDIEPNDTVADATPIGVSGVAEPEQQLCGPMDVDVFSFFAFEGEKITSTIEFAHEDGDIDMNLYAPDVEENVDTRGLATRTSLSVDDNEEIEYVADQVGNHYLVVYGYGKSNTYTLTTEIEIPEMCSDDDMFDGMPADNHAEADAQQVDLGTYGPLQICAATEDWYKFDAQPNDWITVTLRVTEGDLDDVSMDLFLNGSPEESGARNGDKITVDAVAFAENTYHVRVNSTSDVTYQLSLSLSI